MLVLWAVRFSTAFRTAGPLSPGSGVSHCHCQVSLAWRCQAKRPHKVCVCGGGVSRIADTKVMHGGWVAVVHGRNDAISLPRCPELLVLCHRMWQWGQRPRQGIGPSQ